MLAIFVSASPIPYAAQLDVLRNCQGMRSSIRLLRKGNTHAKVLLVDSRYFVTTSFNWLSFKGDPAQPMREEEGTLVEGVEAVDAYFHTHIERMQLLKSRRS